MAKYSFGRDYKSQKHPPTTEHNHKKVLAAMYAAGTLDIQPGISDITVQHDDWCDLLRGRGYCNCEPDIIPGKPQRKVGTA